MSLKPAKKMLRDGNRLFGPASELGACASSGEASVGKDLPTAVVRTDIRANPGSASKTTKLFSKIKTYLTGMHPTSVHLMGGYLMGVYLTGMYRTGVY